MVQNVNEQVMPETFLFHFHEPNTHSDSSKVDLVVIVSHDTSHEGIGVVEFI